MTRKQIFVSTILALLFSPPFPDPLTDMQFRFPCALTVLLTLFILGRTSMMQEAKRGLQRLVAGLVTACVVLLTGVLQLTMILVSMHHR